MDENWRQQSREINRRIEELTRRGACYSCHNLRTGDVFPDQVVVWDDVLFQIVLEPYPRGRSREHSTPHGSTRT